MRRGRVFILFPAHGNLPDSPGLFFTGIILLISCPGTTAQNHMPEQKGDDTHALGQPIRGHDKSLAGMEKQTALHIMKRRFLLTTHFDFIALRRF